MAKKNTTQVNENQIVSRDEQFIVCRRTAQTTPAGVEPLDVSVLANLLSESPDIELLSQTTLNSGEVHFVVTMDNKTLNVLNQQLGPAVIIERNVDLELFESNTVSWFGAGHDPGLSPAQDDDEEIAVTVSVRAADNPSQGVAGATVYLLGQLWPSNAITDANGDATLVLFGESLDSVRGLYVKPRDTFWSLWVDNPVLTQESNNIAQLRTFDETYPGFPQQETRNWGLEAMEVDKIAATLNGSGVRIAIIDSGLATDHDDLAAGHGFDFTSADNPEESWQTDTVMHGSHCAGVISGLANHTGVLGFAPQAELHIFKVFPGGKLSSLIGALDKCIVAGVDIVNLSLGTKSRSQLLEEKISEAKANGVACIAAAGNSRDAVQYPAAFPEVLAVAAIGKLLQFPADSYHQRQIGEHQSINGEYFSAAFTCFGDEIDVCAPGIAVLSTVSGGSYAIWDGTSMACPHVVGLAALLLQSDTQLQAMSRNTQRVAALFAALKSGCVDLGLPGIYQGAGMPTASKLGIELMPDVAEDSLTQIEAMVAQALTLAKQLA